MSAKAGLEALPFGEFLAVLNARGFAITPQHHLRLARLLERTGPSLSPADLKRLLAPIFATNAGDQEAFYAAFDDYFRALVTPYISEPIGPGVAPDALGEDTSTKRRWLAYLIIAAVTLVAGLAILLSHPVSPPPGGHSTPGLTPLPTPTPPQSTPDPSRGSEDDGLGKKPKVSPNPLPSTPRPSAQVSPGERAAGFVQQHRIQLQSAVLFVVLIGFLMGEWQRWRKRNLLIERARKRKPPFSWPVHVGAPKIRELHGQPLYDAARALRRRQAADTERLDLFGTLQATIRNGGLPRLVYRRGSRVPEYLVLIDCASPRDHQAAYFDQLVATLEREGVFIARYFFRRDPRICWDERATTSLADLRRLHADHRLLIIGDGAGLLDPLTGDPAPWLPLLTEWREQTLLTPVPSARWGLREETLESLLPVMPATLEALAEVPDLLERGSVEARLRTWHDDGPMPPKAGRPVPIESLRAYLGVPAFDWLCACAIYPELQWNLTLFLAGKLSTASDLLTEAAILRFARLPWFREGDLPDELRARLLAVLPVERQLLFRRALIELLEANPPPRDSHAADAREIDIAIHRNWIARHDRSLHANPPPATTLPLGEQTRDYSELRLHEPIPSSGLALLLPTRLRTLAYDKALAPLGIRPILRFTFAILIAGLGYTLIDRMGHEPSPPEQRLVTPGPTPTPPPQVPFAKPVPGKPGFVISPYDTYPYKGYIDVRGFPLGTEVKDPYSGKMFLVPAVPSTPEPAKNARFNEVLNLGKALREQGDMSTAVTRFREAQAMDGKSPEPIYEIAITFEKMQLPDKAAELWRRIFDMGESAGPYFTTAEARLKVAKESLIKNVDDGIAAGKTLGLLAITTVDEKDSTSAKRLAVRIPIKARAREKINVRDLTIQVLFYDIVDNQNLVQTTANVSSRWTSAPADWLDSTTETLEVDYQLPLPEARVPQRENRKYFGYLVRLYYKGDLQAAAGEPEKLMQQFPPEQKITNSAGLNVQTATMPAPLVAQATDRIPYQSSADFEKYAQMLRENALLNHEPPVLIPTANRPVNSSKYPWKNNIVTIVFNVGYVAKGKPNRNASVWDPKWRDNFGGIDDPNPDKRQGYICKAFVPRQNPFYVALPYNDVSRGTTKPEAKVVIPWFKEEFEKEGQSVCRDRWVRIRNRDGRDCYAQWSDCGPSGTDHWQYVFGDERPKPNVQQGAGLEISPAVRDFLGLNKSDVTDWQFVDFKDVPRGPWALYGDNSPFVQRARQNSSQESRLDRVEPADSRSTGAKIITRPE